MELSELESEVLSAYQEDPSYMASEIANQNGYDTDEILSARSELVEDGFLEQEWRGSGTVYRPSI